MGRFGRRLRKATRKLKKTAKTVASATKKAAHTVSKGTKAALDKALKEAEAAAKAAADVAKDAKDVVVDVVEEVADFAKDDVANAARMTVRWTGRAAEDVADWATDAPGDVKEAIMRAADFVDDVADATSTGMASAADAVDDVLGDLEQTLLPDGVVITVGPFDVSSEGVSFKPKFEIGLVTPGMDFSVGIEDLRDGLNVGITLDMILFEVATEGDDLQEVRHASPLPIGTPLPPQLHACCRSSTPWHLKQCTVHVAVCMTLDFPALCCASEAVWS